MDLNCVTWLLAIATAEQHHVDAQREPVLSHYASPIACSSYLNSGMNVKSVGGVRPVKHPWHRWEKDYLYPHQHAEKMAGLASLMEFVEELFHNQNLEPEDWRRYVFDRQDLLSMAGATREAVSVGIA